MTNAELFETIKIINRLEDTVRERIYDNGKINREKFESMTKEEEKEYYENTSTQSYLLDSITIYCPRWKYYHAYDVRQSYKTGHWYVVFNN